MPTRKRPKYAGFSGAFDMAGVLDTPGRGVRSLPSLAVFPCADVLGVRGVLDTLGAPGAFSCVH